ncbi:MAG TPA: glycoside hydrolase [Tissierellia bacterium]|nr:glycoside hydrolase [Tissierellia bacterium]
MKILLGLLILSLLISCGLSDDPTPTETEPTTEPVSPDTAEAETIEPETTEPPTEEPTDPVAEIMAGMTLRQKIGQLFIIRPEGLDFSLDAYQVESDDYALTELTDTAIQNLQDYPVGGFTLFTKNLIDPDQLNRLLEQLAGHLSLAPFISVDEEGGLVTRLASHPAFDVPVFPNMALIALSGDPDQAREAALSIGDYLIRHGFNLNFAPVADVNSNPDNPVIGERAFSSDPFIAAQMVEAAVQGFHDAGMMATLKHFPGHGDTATDTHYDTAVSYKTWADMAAMELIPFEAGIKAGADMVMLAHILTPEVSGDDLPASLSPEIHRLLRQELGFDGIIITDSLAMRAISDHFSPAETALLSFQAGNDIQLLPAHLPEAFDALEQAITDGTIDEAELDERVRRILSLKLQYGLIEQASGA